MPSSKAILDLLSDIGAACPAGYAAALHFGFHAPRFLFQTYPAAWRAEYTRDSLMVSDPALKWGLVNSGTLRWSAIPDAERSDVMQRAARHAIAFGFTFSHEGTVFNGARSDREFTDDEITHICAQVSAFHDLTADLDALGDQLTRQLHAHSIAVTHGR